MLGSINEYVYLFTYILGIYVIYKFMHIFTGEKPINKRMEFISYCISYLLITTLYLYIGVPIIMLIGNFSILFLLTYNYKISIKKRISTVLYIYLITMIVEIIVVLLISFTKFNVNIFSTNDFISILSYVLINTFQYLAAILVGNYKNIRNSEPVPFSKWVYISLVPVVSIIVILVSFTINGITFIQITSITLGIFVINFSMLYLFDTISLYFVEKTEKILMENQNKFYCEQLEIMKTSVNGISTLKHDMNNHLSTLYLLMKNQEINKAIMHVDNMLQVCDYKKNIYSNTGNIVVDSILNFKLRELAEQDTKIICNVKVPSDIEFESFAITTILGNLIDNAVEAVTKIKEKNILK